MPTFFHWLIAAWENSRDWIVYRWGQVRQAIEVLRRVGFGVGVIVISALALLVAPEGREIAMRAGETWGNVWVWALAALLLSVQVWFWSYHRLSSKYVPEDSDDGVSTPIQEPVFSHVPETAVLYSAVRGLPLWLAALSVLAPLLAVAWMWWNDQYKASHGFAVMIALLIVLAVVVAVGWYFDRQLSAFSPTSPAHRKAWWIAFSVSTAQIAGLVIWGMASPYAMGELLGSGPILLLALASLVPAGTVLVSIGAWLTFPLLGTMCLVSLFLSAGSKGYVRELVHYHEDTRPTLMSALEAWRGQQPASEPTMVVVATAGGGITAAYWSATVLERMRQADPKLPAKLFTISGVSGGSVGSALFAESLYCGNSQSVLEILGADLLSPTLTTLLFDDMVYWFTPVSVLSKFKHTDRATTFEQQLERLWQSDFGCEGTTLESPFFLRAGGVEALRKRWLPILMLNSTHEQTGRLVIMSQAQLTTADDKTTGYFESAIDYFSMTRAEMRMSTAALNSARFPYVSPVGALQFPKTTGFSFAGHVADGGYFNNDGATTLLKVLRTLEPMLDGIKLVVVQVSIDEPVDQDATTQKFLANQIASSGSLANELTAPLRTVVSVRGGHGEDARNELKQWALGRKDKQTSYFHYRLLIPERSSLAEKYRGKDRTPVKPPLGWMLSPVSQLQIREDTLCLEGNYRQWTSMMEQLGGKSPVTGCGVEARAVASGLTPPLPPSPLSKTAEQAAP